MIDVSKMVAESWKCLSSAERSVWQEMSSLDKARYEQEKATYRGPWKVNAADVRLRKDPYAPKRPMSAYLSFANKKRSMVKAVYPTATNGQISKMLSSLWRQSPQAIREPYIQEEAKLRQIYHEEKATWLANKKEQQLREQSVPANSHLAACTLPEIAFASNLIRSINNTFPAWNWASGEIPRHEDGGRAGPLPIAPRPSAATTIATVQNLQNHHHHQQQQQQQQQQQHSSIALESQQAQWEQLLEDIDPLPFTTAQQQQSDTSAMDLHMTDTASIDFGFLEEVDSIEVEGHWSDDDDWGDVKTDSWEPLPTTKEDGTS